MENFQLRFTAENVEAASRWICLGLFFKLCLADNIAAVTAKFVTDPANPFHVWADNVFFGYRIYYDFAGYSFIALGLGQAFGIRLTLNFESPYLTRNLQSFWRTWHRSLSNWFRDYLYLRIGGSRGRFRALAVIAVFLVSGLWHGAGWNFLIWGVFHGVFLVLFRMMPQVNWPKFAAWLCTFVLVIFSWLYFYETDAAMLLKKTQTLLDPRAYSLEHLRALPSLFPSMGLVFNGLCIMTLVIAAHLAEWISMKWRGEPYRCLLGWPACIAMLILTIILAPASEDGFIYFNF